MRNEVIHLGHKIIPSNLFNGCYIVLMPKKDDSKAYTMEHFESVDEAKAFIDRIEDKPETWFERHLT